MDPFETPDPFKITMKLKCSATSTITCVEFWDLKHETWEEKMEHIWQWTSLI
jgi:hypothetical protein